MAFQVEIKQASLIPSRDKDGKSDGRIRASFDFEFFGQSPQQHDVLEFLFSNPSRSLVLKRAGKGDNGHIALSVEVSGSEREFQAAMRRRAEEREREAKGLSPEVPAPKKEAEEKEEKKESVN